MGKSEKSFTIHSIREGKNGQDISDWPAAAVRPPPQPPAMTSPVSAGGGDVAINNPPQVVPTERPTPPKGSDLFGGTPVVIVASEAYHDGSHHLIGSLDYAKRDGSKPSHQQKSLQERVEKVISNLSQSRSSVFMEKIQSLASAIKKLFTHSHPDFRPQPMEASAIKKLFTHSQPKITALQKSYDQILNKAEKTIQKSKGQRARRTLYKMDNLREAVKNTPELSKQIGTASRDELVKILKDDQFYQIFSCASKLQSLTRGGKEHGGVRAAMAYDTIISRDQTQKSEDRIIRTIDALNRVLNHEYESGNQELDKALGYGRHSFRDFFSAVENPFETLKSNPDFGEAEEQHLRAWLQHGLQQIANASQIIDDVMLGKTPES